MDIYDKLYEETQHNLTAAGKEMEFTKDAFLKSTTIKSGMVNLLKLRSLDNQSFYQAAYVALFYRIPDASATSKWKNECHLDNEEFQKKLVHSLLNSEEYLSKKVKVYNNIYSPCHIQQKNYNYTKPKKLNYFIEHIYPIYVRMPNTFKKMMKKIFKK